MKKVFKKNQIIITTLAIMIAVAGYLNFAGKELGTVEEGITASSKNVENNEVADISDISDISDEDVYAQNEYGTVTSEDLASETLEEEAVLTEAGAKQDIESTDFDLTSNTTEESTPGEAVLTSASGNLNFIAEAKLSREQVRAKNKETLLEVMNNANITDTQKQNAIDSMIAMTDIAEREAAAELLLEAKGFTDVVVSITGDSADVVVNMAEVTDAGRAQIEDIMKRKTGVSPENIVITPISAENQE